MSLTIVTCAKTGSTALLPSDEMALAVFAPSCPTPWEGWSRISVRHQANPPWTFFFHVKRDFRCRPQELIPDLI